MQPLRILYLAVVLAGFVLPRGLARAQGEPAVVEAVEVRGDAGGARGYVEAALGLEPGQTLPREELSARLVQAESRLEALGYFRTVDLALEKGSQRGRYRVVAVVEAQSAAYAGATVVHRTERRREAYTKVMQRERRERQAVFAGTRDFAHTGLRLDLELSRDAEIRRGDASGRDLDGDERRLEALGSAVMPDLGGTPLFAGAVYWYQDRDVSTRWTFEQPQLYRSSSRTDGDGSNQIGFLVGGARLGRTTIGAFFGRGRSIYRARNVYQLNVEPPVEQHFDFDAWYSFHGGQLLFSEKSNLAVVEPGLVARLNFDRTVGPNGWQRPSVDAMAQNTFLLRSAHALTPTGVVQYDWTGSSTPDRPYLRRTYDIGLTYDYVTPWDVVVGVEHATVGPIGRNDPNLPARRTRLSLRYVTSSLIASLHFIYGAEGLPQVRDVSDTTRTGQP